jgi:hypothetical protein
MKQRIIPSLLFRYFLVFIKYQIVKVDNKTKKSMLPVARIFIEEKERRADRPNTKVRLVIQLPNKLPRAISYKFLLKA